MGMELPLQAIRRQIASGVDLIVYLGRLRDKTSRLLEITEVTGMEGDQVGLNPLFPLPGRPGKYQAESAGYKNGQEK